MVALSNTDWYRLDSITQYGITWTFDRKYLCGQFVNGDWWIVGPAKIIAISPTPGGGRDGSMLNPRFGMLQGYDDRVDYSASLSVSAPITLNPGDSLVSCQSHPTLTDYSYVKSAAVLTAVDVAQTPDKFRPPLCRPTRVSQSSSDPYLFSVNQIQWNLLPKLPRSTIASVPALAGSIAKVSRPWITHFGNPEPGNPSLYAGGAAPSDNQRSYGQYVADWISEVSLQLVLDYPDADIRPLLIGMIQVGIDHYGTYEDGGTWEAAAGIFQGRKWPILYAGIMLDHAGMKNLSLYCSKPYEPGKYTYRFAEDGHTYYYDDPSLPDWVDNTGLPLDAGDPGAFRCRGQKGWIGVLNGQGSDVLWRIRDFPGWSGLVTLAHEHLHVNDWSANPNLQEKMESYRGMTCSMSYVGYALAAQIISVRTPVNARTLWNHNAFFDYVDRWMTEDDTLAYQAVTARYGPYKFDRQRQANGVFVNQMWAKYR